MNINLIQNDTGVGRDVTLLNENGAVDLTDAAVLFLFGEHVLNPIKLVEQGKVRLVFEKAHTDKLNYFNAAFKVTFSDGREETFPGADDEKLKVHVTRF